MPRRIFKYSLCVIFFFEGALDFGSKGCVNITGDVSGVFWWQELDDVSNVCITIVELNAQCFSEANGHDGVFKCVTVLDGMYDIS